MSKKYFWWFVAIAAFLVLLNLHSQPQPKNISWDDFLNKVEKNRVKKVIISENRIAVLNENNQSVWLTFVPPGEVEYLKLLRAHRVRTVVKPPSDNSWVSWVLFLVAPLVFMLILLFFLRRSMGAGPNGNNGPFGLVKLGSKQIKENVKTTFADVAGMDEVKHELEETVEYLREPAKFERLGGRVPRGLLLVGAPGTGKTLLGRAMAGESKSSFFYISGSEFVELYVGVGATRVRELFEHAKKAAPSIIFIDEIDAVGRSRGTGLGNGNDEREQTLNQLLVEMDGFKGREAMIVVAATNRPDVLDQALLRPGRFDRHILVPIPDLNAREAILKVHSKKITLAPDAELSIVARALPAGFTGADIENVVNEAALIAARENKTAVTQSDLVAARDRIIMGPERKAVLMTSEERKVVAYHEAGHAIAAHYTPEADPVHRVTIVPHGMALGLTMMLPERDLYVKSRQRLFAEICVCYGGRAAEEMFLNSISTGAKNDFERATAVAISMVTEYGMSHLGERVYGSSNEMTFFGRNFNGERNYSEATAQLIDEEVKKIISEARSCVNGLLEKNSRRLHALAQVLLQKETVERGELEQILDKNN